MLRPLGSAATFEFEVIPWPRAWIALALSVSVHLLVLVYLTDPRLYRERPPTALLVTLVPLTPTVTPASPTYFEPAHSLDAAPDHSPRRTNAEASRSPPVAPRQEVTVGIRPLNLRLPAFILASPPTTTDGPFDPEFAAAITLRKETRIGNVSAAQRRAQRMGLSAANYAHEVAAGHAVKSEAGCFDLRQEQSVSDAPLWWRARCREARLSAWEQAEAAEAQLHRSLRHH